MPNTARAISAVKQQKNHDAKGMRQAILDAAQVLFLKEGYDKVSMRNIAARIGYTATTIYHYFRNKDEIIFHLNEAVFEKMMTRLNAVSLDTLHPSDRLRKMLNTYIEVGLEEPESYKLAFLTTVNFGDTLDAYLPEESYIGKFYKRVEEVVAAAISMGRNPNRSAGSVGDAIWMIVHGFVSAMVVFPTFPWQTVEDTRHEVIEAAMAVAKG